MSRPSGVAVSESARTTWSSRGPIGEFLSQLPLEKAASKAAAGASNSFERT